jgi:hypothetical protein
LRPTPISTLTAALLLGAALTSSCGEQPAVQCTASRSTFAARYRLQSGTGPCAELVGDLLGVQTYVVDPHDRGDGRNTVAIKAQSTATDEVLGLNAVPTVADPNPDHRPYALGKFTAIHPDGNGICTVEDMSPAELERGPVPTNRAPDPAVHVKHTWKNVRFLVTPALTGVAFEADLTYELDGCVAEYKVTAISPAASCDNSQLQPDQALCSPDRDPSNPRFGGSGISPEFATECMKDPARDPQWLVCMPAGPFPSFK